MGRQVVEIIHWVDCDSPIGQIRIASTQSGLAYIELPHANGRGLRGWLRRHAAGAEFQSSAEHNSTYVNQIREYFAGEREKFDFPLDIRATEFQRDVYVEVGRIPYGHQRSYAEIAEAVGRPKAVRAVGAANGANPVPLVIPCHRVIASRGRLGGFSAPQGIRLKQRMLEMEANGE